VLVLAVHTTSSQLGVAVAEPGRVRGAIVLPPSKEHLENLVPTMLELTRDLRVNLTDIDGFAVAIGPGSFSGIRIGLATIKGIALALDKPMVGVSSLEILAWEGLEGEETGAAIIDARRHEVYMATYRRTDPKLSVLAPPRLLGWDAVEDTLSGFSEGSHVVTGEPVAGLTDRPTIRFRAASHSPARCALLACERLLRNQADDIHQLGPVYIRKSDAEEKAASKAG
jgi:tRNA threonylcarbamoyladenosine biosynthesis protein TsaB